MRPFFTNSPKATIVVAALVSLAQPAHAQVDSATAKQLYDEGLTNYNLGHYEQALNSFEMGYRVKRDAAFLFNLGQCLRQLHRYDDALRSYRAYLRESPNLAETTRDQVQKLVAEMQRAIDVERAKMPPPGTQPPTESRPQQTATPPQLTSGVEPASTPTMTGDHPRRPWYQRRAGMAISGVGVAGAAVGAALLGVAGVDANNARHASSLPDQRRFNDDAGTFSTAGAITLAVGGALVVAGIVVLSVRR